MDLLNLETLLKTPYEKLNRVFLFAIVFLSIFSPPYLTIFIFYRELFFKLNFINLFFLCFSISFPLYLFNFYIIYNTVRFISQIEGEKDFEEIKYDIIEQILIKSARQNLFVFYTAFFISILIQKINVISLISNYIELQIMMFLLTIILPFTIWLRGKIDKFIIYYSIKLSIILGSSFLVVEFGSPIINEIVSSLQ